MGNIETKVATLDTRHRTKTNKKNLKKKTTQKTKQMNNKTDQAKFS